MSQTIDQRIDTLDRIRNRAEDRAFDRLCQQYDKAEQLIGEICRDGKTVYYINQRSRDGRPTGRTIEATNHATLVDYAIRNRYV